jgi:hypothetical protein
MNIEDIKKVEVGPSDVILIRVKLPNEITRPGPRRHMLDGLKDLQDDVFPHNKVILLDGGTEVEVLHAEPDYDTIAREVAKRMAEHVARA